MTKTWQYVCAHDMRPENPLHVRLLELWRQVAVETEGRLEVETIPWGGVGPSKVMLAKLLSNEVQFHPVSGMPMSTVVQVAAMEGLPFAYPTSDDALRILDSPFGNHIRREIAAKGLHVFPNVWPQGFNQITSSTIPIRTVADLDGFKLRIAQVPYKVDLFSALGCDVQQVHYQGIYDALKSGRAAGEETPYLYIEIDHFADVQTYLSVTNHRFASFWFCANAEGWRALPQDIRDAVDRNMKKYVQLYRQDMADGNAAACERLKTRLTFNDADVSTFVSRLKENGFYARWRKEFGETAWSLLEAERGPMP
jgi:TRAP-type C4-dicarboxylate transport system substrate-binding protein